MRRVLLLSLAFLSISTLARAQSERAPSSQLTSKGRIMPSGSIGGFWSNSVAGYGGYPTWNVHVDPAATYFVRDRLGVSLGVHGAWAKHDGVPDVRYTSREIGVSAGIVWNAVLSQRWSIMPGLSIGYAREWANRLTFVSMLDTRILAPSDVRNTLNYVRIRLALPLIYAVSDALGIGVGPDLQFDHLFALETSLSASDEAMIRTTATTKPNRAQVGASVGLYASF